MAKRTAARSTRTEIIRMPRPAAPIIRVAAPRAAPAKKKHHRKSVGGKGGKSGLVACAAAGFALGYLDKNATTFPTIPVLGRAGTLAVALYYWKGSIFGFSTRDLSEGFAAIAAYEYATKGSISGPGGW
jgi:hypothetical protein